MPKKKISVLLLKPHTPDALCRLVEYLDQMGMDVHPYNGDMKRTRKEVIDEVQCFDAALNGKDVVILPSDTIEWWGPLEKRYLRALKKRGIPYFYFRTYWDGGWDNYWDNKLRLHQDEDPDDVLEKILTLLNRTDELSDLAKEGLKKKYCGRYIYWMETKGVSTEKKELTPDELKEYEALSTKYGWTLRKEPVSLYAKHEYRARMRSELLFIEENHLANHFLGLLHILNFKKGRIFISKLSIIPFGGFLVSYALGMTDYDPLDMNLVFERGISPIAPLEIHLNIHPDDRDKLNKYIRDLKVLSGITVELHTDDPEYESRLVLDKIIAGSQLHHWSAIPLNESKTMNALACLDTWPSFVEADVKNAIRWLKPQNMNELYAAFSMISGRAWFKKQYFKRKDNPNIEYLTDDVRHILEDTKGILNYDEQTIRLAEKIGNFTFKDANQLRKNIAKRINHRIEEAKEKFLTYAISQRYSLRAAQTIFTSILATGERGTISKSYILSQALLLYRIVYMKTQYRREYERACAGESNLK